MSYDANVLRRATARLEQNRRQREEREERLRLEVYRQEPRVEQLDRRIQGTMAGLVAAALRQGGDPVQAVQSVRQENQNLQRERAVLLGALGLPEDALEEKPVCPLCRDRGWRGASMCQCLRELCAQEQIKELSKLLDLGEQSFDSFRLDYYSQTLYPGMGSSPRSNMELVYDVREVCHQVWPLHHQKPLPLRRPRPGEDLPVRLHRPRRVRAGLFGGLRHGGKYFCPVRKPQVPPQQPRRRRRPGRDQAVSGL